MEPRMQEILTLDDSLVIEACKNFKLGVASELRKRSSGTERIPDDAALALLRALPLEGAAKETRDALLNESDRTGVVQFGRLLLLAAAQDECLRPYVDGALEGAKAGVRAIDPVSILAIGVAIFLVGRLLPNISFKMGDVTLDIKPVINPLQGLSELVKAIPLKPCQDLLYIRGDFRRLYPVGTVGHPPSG
jgi:hypothetical protein